MKNTILTLLILCICGMSFTQQIADTSYNPSITNPEYEFGKGPVVFIDEGHHNFHTRDGRYLSFAILLERDGYKVNPYQGEFTRKKLQKGKILVISNALNEINVQNWYLPTPSAFAKPEIEIVKKWVIKGGSLFLIADHMPMGGAAMELAAAFDVEFTNGFAIDTTARGPAFFNKEDGTLAENRITNGRNPDEYINKIASFTGQAFKIPDEASPILVLNDNFINLLPDTAWVFTSETKRMSAEGWSQGAFMKYGKGRVVIFGEAAMFSAQLAGPQRVKAGMNNDLAKENYKLLLNIIHWLDSRY